MIQGSYKAPIRLPKGIYRTNFLIFYFSVFRPFCPLNPFKTTLKVVLEVLLDVPEVLLEVLDLSRRSWAPLRLLCQVVLEIGLLYVWNVV